MVRKMSVRAEDDGDVIDVDVSDDEKYNSDNVFQGLWIPYPDQVAEMFEKLDKGGVPVLKWRCPGRRPPEIEKEEEDMETDLNLAVEPKPEEQKEEKIAPAPTEFDFDDTSLETSTKLTPRKTPGSSKGKKRVARMDKVLDDMIRQRKATEASKDQRKKVTPKTPRGAGGGRFFSSPRTPMSAEKYAPSITPPTTPRGSGAKSPHNRLLGAKYNSPFRSAPTSPRTPSSPKTPTSAERTPATSPVGSATVTAADKVPSPIVAKETDASEGTAKTTSAATSTMTTTMSTTTTTTTAKCSPLTQALMSEPMVSSNISDSSLFNKPRNSLPQVTTHPVSNTAVVTTTTAINTTTAAATTASPISAPVSCSLSTNSSAHPAAATHQHFTAAQTVGGQRPSLSLFAHQNSGVGQGSPQTGMVVRVTQSHLPNSPLAQPAQSPHAQSPLSQPAHSPMTHTSLSPMNHNVQSPMTQLSQSPLSQPIQSPMSQTTHSPISQPIQSPMSQHSQSPMAQSPMAQPVPSPMSQPAQSPTAAQSPLAQAAQSPSASSQSPISQVGQLRGIVQQNIPGAKPRLTLSGKPRLSTPDKPRLSMASKPRLSLASPLTVSTSTIQSHLSSTPTLQAQLNQAVQHQVLQQHLNQTNQQQVSQLVQQRAQAISQQQMNQAVAQQQMASVTESAPAQLSQQQQQQQQLTQQQQQLAQQLQLNQQSQAQLSQQQQQQLAQQQQQQLAQQQLSQQQQLQQLSQQQAQTPQLTPQQKQQLTLALAQQQLNQQQQTGTQSMSPQMAHQLSQLIKQQKIQVTLRQQRAAQQQQQMAQVKAQQLASNQQLVQQQLAQINAQQMAQTTTSQPQLVQSTVQTTVQATAQPNVVTAASPAPKVWSKPSAQHQLLQAALSQVPQNQTSLSQMIQAVKSRMNPANHPQLFKSISQLTQANQSQLNQSTQLHVNQPQTTLTSSSSPKLSTLVMSSQSPTTPAHIVSSTTPFHSSETVPNTSSQASGHLTQVVYHSQAASHVTNPSQVGGTPPISSIAQATITQQVSPAITQPSLLVRKEETTPAQHTQLGIQRNESSDYKLSIFTQASTPSAIVTAAETVAAATAAAAQFVSQAQVTPRTDASQSLSRMLPNLGRKSSLTGEIGGLSTPASVPEMPTSQASTNIGQSLQTSTTAQTRFVPSNLLQTSTESTLLTRERFAAPTEAATIASNQERFTLATMGQAMNRAAHPTVSQASELPSPSGRERLTLASMLQPFDLAGLSQQEKQTLSTLTQSRDLSFLQNSESEGNTANTQQFSTINKTGSTVGFPQTHMQIGESQAPAVSQSYIMPSYGVSAMIGKPPPPYSVAIAEKALSSMRTSMAGRKDPNIVSQLPSATSGTDKTVTFVKKPETSLPSSTVSVWVNTPNTSSEVGTNIVSSQSSVVTPQLTTAGAAQVSVQKISLQQQQQPQQQQQSTSEANKTLVEKDDKQTLDLVNNSLSAVRTAISMGNHMYPQSVPKDNLLIRKNLLGFSSLNKPSSTTSDTTSVTTTGTSSIAANNSLLQHMLGTSTSEHLTSTAHLIPSSMSHMSTHELNLQKMSLSSASVTSSSNLGALTTSLPPNQPSTTQSTPSTRPRLTTIAALLNIDSGPKTQAELQLRQLAMAGLTAGGPDGQSVKSTLGQTLGVISPAATNYSTDINKTVSSSSIITTASQITMVPATVSKPNLSNQPITSTVDSSQTEQQQQQTPTSES